MFRAGAARTGFVAGETTLSVGNVGGLAKRWTYPTGGYLSSSPAVANGLVYVSSGDDEFYASDAADTTDCSEFGENFAFDAAGSIGCSGTSNVCPPLLETFGGGLSAGPRVANGRVYISTGTDLDGFTL